MKELGRKKGKKWEEKVVESIREMDRDEMGTLRASHSKNWSIFDKVITEIKVAPFYLRHSVI